MALIKIEKIDVGYDQVFRFSRLRVLLSSQVLWYGIVDIFFAPMAKIQILSNGLTR